MFIPGIKIGLQPDWRDKLIFSQAKFTEIWYRIDRAGDYQELFNYLKRQKIYSGIHFWGILPSGHLPSIAYQGEALVQSLKLIEKTIENAARNQSAYVNIHIGHYRPLIVDFDHQLLYPDPHFPGISPQEAIKYQTQSLIQLGESAKQKGVRLLVESIPAKLPQGSWDDPEARINLPPVSHYGLPALSLTPILETGSIGFTNDFCHLLSETFNQPRHLIMETFFHQTQTLLPFTQLIHFNTMVPPLNGTDAHYGITEADFAISDLTPNRDELIKLLKIFSNRDLWLIPEPHDHHVLNHQSLLRLLATVSTL